MHNAAKVHNILKNPLTFESHGQFSSTRAYEHEIILKNRFYDVITAVLTCAIAL